MMRCRAGTLSNTQTDQPLPVSAVVLSAHDEP
jgi:hypothetical protein